MVLTIRCFGIDLEATLLGFPLCLTDIAHHHLAIVFIFLIAGHMYRTNFGIGHSIKDLLEAPTSQHVIWAFRFRSTTQGVEISNTLLTK
jgi:hypothetical protein